MYCSAAAAADAPYDGSLACAEALLVVVEEVGAAIDDDTPLSVMLGTR